MFRDYHYYYGDIAMSVGLEAAILYEFLCKEVEFEIMNGEKTFDGFHWANIKIEYLSKRFPYISETKMKRALKNLEKANLIKIMGCYCECPQYEKGD